MAIFRLSAKPISRGKGQSAVAAAAYRSGESLRDARTGEVKDYAARAHAVVFSGVFAPKDAPEWAHNREQLWNHVEQAEQRKDARLAREIQLSLPHEMTDQQREWLVKDFVREQFTRRDLVVDVAIHAPDRQGDERNHHAHLMVTERTVDADGFAATKDRALNSKAQLAAWREEWANLANRHLERHGLDARIDHRSNAERGIDAEPTKYEGPHVTELARSGIITDRRQENDDIRLRNAERELRPPPDLWPDRADERQPTQFSSALIAQLDADYKAGLIDEHGQRIEQPTQFSSSLIAQLDADYKAGLIDKHGQPKTDAAANKQLAADRAAVGGDLVPSAPILTEADLDAERERVAPQIFRSGPEIDFEWTSRGGLNAQQKSATHYMLWKEAPPEVILRPQRPEIGGEAPSPDDTNRQHTAEQEKLAASPVATEATQAARQGEASPAPAAAPSKSEQETERDKILAAFDSTYTRSVEQREQDHEQDGGRGLDR